MTKSELRRQLLIDTAKFVEAGNRIDTLEPQKVRIKTRCTGKSSNNTITGGDVPTFKISGLYNSEAE